MGRMLSAGDDGDECYRGEGWRKSSYSLSNGHCLETARFAGGIGVRDSKATDGPVLRFGSEVWSAFVTELGTLPSR
jgi:Domain of unknown function (DUF397)